MSVVKRGDKDDPRTINARSNELLITIEGTGQSRQASRCEAKDYSCQIGEYSRMVFSKCTPTTADSYDCFVAEQTKLVEANPNDAAAYFYRAIIYSNRDASRSAADFKKVLELDPKCLGAYSQLSYQYVKSGEYDQAIAVLNKGLELEPGHAGFYDSRGRIHLEQKSFVKALADFDKVIELSPDSDKGYIGRAKVYSAQRDSEKALAEYDKAIRANPRGWRSYYERGFIYWGRGEKAKAETDCRKAKEVKQFARVFPPEPIASEYCSL
jgi:tetratricopeptide (TPR) repeat protein